MNVELGHAGDKRGNVSEPKTEHLQVLVYDIDLKAPACVLLQAAYGCGPNPAALRYFDPKYWLTAPTPGMRKIAGTPEQWKRAADITAATWGDKQPQD